MSKTTKTYEELQQSLDEILQKIQSEDGKGNLSELLKIYEEGETILKKMQDHLDNAKNTIKKLDS